jgi:tetratricopeptide (TPR) repeat protein
MACASRHSESLCDYLQSLAKPDLVRLILDHADEAFRSHLELQAARHASKGPDLARFRGQLQHVLDDMDGCDPWMAPTGASGLGRFADSLRGLIQDGHSAAAMALAEEALDGLEAVYENVDDSDGELADAATELREIHRLACGAAELDRVRLAEWLFRREMHNAYGLFDGLLNEYRPVLGDAGLAHYRRRAEEIWDRIPPLGTGQEAKGSEDRWHITSIMRSLAADDPEALLEVHLRDLSSAYRFLEVAEHCLKAGWPDRALEWAERGAKAFPKSDARLLGFLAERYAKTHLIAEALELRWMLFRDYPELESYQRLLEAGKRAGEASVRREQALAFLRERFATGKGHPNRFQRTDLDLLTRIHLHEKAPMDALSAAREGGCTHGTWMLLAKRLEDHNPHETIQILRDRLETIIAPMKEDSYREAVNVLQRIQALAQQVKQPGVFTAILAQVMTTHGRKRNLVARIKKVGLV